MAEARSFPREAVAFAWGAAEATVFFIVPDVWLTFLVTRSRQAPWRPLAWCLAGALAGGLFMWWRGAADATGARAVLNAVPAIGPEVIARVDGQIDRHGLLGLFLGPFGGLPYKVYAVEWGARHGSPALLLAASLVARGARFALSVLVARWVLGRLKRWTRRERHVEVVVVAAFWTMLYVFYFIHFGL